jgi:hypothetical protein
MSNIDTEQIFKVNCIASLIQDLLKELNTKKCDKLDSRTIKKEISKLLKQKSELASKNFSFLTKNYKKTNINVKWVSTTKKLDVDLSTDCDPSDVIKNKIIILLILNQLTMIYLSKLSL